MNQISSDSPNRFRFSWPEPLVIDLIDANYDTAHDPAERLALARLQCKILQDLFDGAANRESLAMRAELVTYCRSRGIGEEIVARADRAVLRELTQIIEWKFRTSPRLRREFGTKLHTAFALLSPPAEPVRAQPRPVARPAWAATPAIA